MSHANLTRVAITGLVLVAAFLPAPGSEACRQWERSYAAYEQQLDEAIQDEPEDLLKELRRHARANAAGHADQAARIEKKIRNGLVGLEAIDPHPDMVRFHHDMIVCYRNGVAVLDAERDQDPAARHAAVIKTWSAMRNLFVTVADLLTSRGCGQGDVDSIKNKYLVHIDAELARLRGESHPAGAGPSAPAGPGQNATPH